MPISLGLWISRCLSSCFLLHLGLYVYFSGFVALWSVSELQFLHGPGYLGLKL